MHASPIPYNTSGGLIIVCFCFVFSWHCRKFHIRFLLVTSLFIKYKAKKVVTFTVCWRTGGPFSKKGVPFSTMIVVDEA